MEEETTPKEYTYIYNYIDKSNQTVATGEKLYWDKEKGKYFKNSKSQKIWVNSIVEEKQDASAIAYFKEAYEFSTWVNKNLSTITVKNIDTSTLDDRSKTELNTIGNAQIFNLEKNDPESKDSAFNEHRRAVIRNSIQSNLNVAIANYNNNSEVLGSTYDFRMPILSETDWEKVLDNVCVISFMQGLPIKTKMYNGYSIISNDVNKETINSDLFYFIDKTTGVYHKIECNTLKESVKNKDSIKAYTNLLFRKQTLTKTDKTTRYYYGHTQTACYDCIISTKNVSTKEEVLTNTKAKPELTTIKTEYYLALARERYNLYKATAVTNYTDLNPSSSVADITQSTSRPTNGKVEIIIKFPDDGKDYEYSTDGENTWKPADKSEIVIEIDENTTIIAKPVEDDNDKTSHDVTNIDKTAPILKSIDVDNKEAGTSNPTVVKSTNEITVMVEGEDDKALSGYKFSIDNGKTWTSDISSEGKYTFKNLKAGTIYRIFAKAIDIAGNESNTLWIDAQTLTITPGQIQISATPTTPRNTQRTMAKHGVQAGPIEVSIKYGVYSGYIYQYSVDGTSNWKNAQEQQTIYIYENQLIYARYYDGAQNEKIYGPFTINNVDNIGPDKPTINTNGYTVDTWTENDIEIEFNAIDRLSKGEAPSNGKIKLYQYSIDNGNTWYDIDSNTDWFEVDKTLQPINKIKIIKDVYKNIKIRAVDEAGNDGEESETIIVKRNSEGPEYEKIEVKNLTSTGYDVYVYNVTDPIGINRVQFPTWTTSGGKDDLVENWETNNAVTGTKQANNTWHFRVNITDHNNEDGEYNTHIYLYDNTEKWRKHELTVVVPKVEKIQFQTDVTTPRNTLKTGIQNGVRAGPITVNITYGDVAFVNNNRYQYKIDNGDWITANKVQEIAVLKNETIYARYFDGLNASETTTYNIRNVDNENPDEFELNYISKINSITMYGWTLDKASVGAEENIAQIKGYQFSVDNGKTWTNLSVVGTYEAVDLKENTQYYLKMKAVDLAGNETITSKQVIAKTIEGILIEANTTEWTNKNVLVTVTYPGDNNYQQQYKIGSGNWQTYSGPITIQKNTTVSARLANVLGYNDYETIRQADYTVGNIDKENPTAPVITNPSVIDKTNPATENNVKWINYDIPLALLSTDTLDGVLGKSGINYYQYKKITDSTWTRISNNTTIPFPEEYNGPVYFQAVDMAGNTSELSETWIKKYTAKPKIALVNSSGGNWTKDDVVISLNVEYDKTGIKNIQYSEDDGITWKILNSGSYTANQTWTTEMNKTIYYKAVNNAGSESDVISTNVRIDRTAPKVKFTPDGNSTYSNKVSTKIDVTDASPLKVLKGRWMEGTTKLTQLSEFSEEKVGWDFNNGDNSKHNNLYHTADWYLWIYAEDTVGNVSIVNSKVFKFDDTGPTVTFDTNGSTTWKKSQSTKVTVLDSGIGVNVDTLKYQWTQSTTEPAANTFSSVFNNEDTIKKSDGTGKDWYLWILAKDTLGNTTITHSNAFYLDNTDPTAGTLTMKLNDSNGGTYSSDTWTNQSVYIAVNNGSDANSGHNSTKYTVDGGTATSAAQILSAEGTHTVVVTTTDNAGNTKSNTYTIKIDKTPPNNYTFNCYGYKYYINTNTGTVSPTDNNGGSGIDKVEVKLDNGEWITVTGDNGEWKYWYTFQNLKAGTTYTVYSRVTDKAGNPTEKQGTAKIPADSVTLAVTNIVKNTTFQGSDVNQGHSSYDIYGWECPGMDIVSGPDMLGDNVLSDLYKKFQSKRYTRTTRQELVPQFMKQPITLKENHYYYVHAVGNAYGGSEWFYLGDLTKFDGNALPGGSEPPVNVENHFAQFLKPTGERDLNFGRTNNVSHLAAWGGDICIVDLTESVQGKDVTVNELYNALVNVGWFDGTTNVTVPK